MNSLIQHDQCQSLGFPVGDTTVCLIDLYLGPAPQFQ